MEGFEPTTTCLIGKFFIAVSVLVKVLLFQDLLNLYQINNLIAVKVLLVFNLFTTVGMGFYYGESHLSHMLIYLIIFSLLNQSYLVLNIHDAFDLIALNYFDCC